MAKIVFVLLDGLSAPTARRCMSAVGAMTNGWMDCGKTVRQVFRSIPDLRPNRVPQFSYTCLDAELPPLSRPAYATILCGYPPSVTGILGNDKQVLCPFQTIFHKAKAAGLITAAAAYCWISELCNRSPFSAAIDRLVSDPSLPIMHGLFYSQDSYPDDELFRDAEALRTHHDPDLLFVHTMGVDYAGHLHGLDSEAYRAAARFVDSLLGRYVLPWFNAGYELIVTSDHGMSADGSHYDAEMNALSIPFWYAGRCGCDLPVAQTEIADFVLSRLGIL